MLPAKSNYEDSVVAKLRIIWLWLYYDNNQTALMMITLIIEI